MFILYVLAWDDDRHIQFTHTLSNAKMTVHSEIRYPRANHPFTCHECQTSDTGLPKVKL
ncbi:hypothetical protein BDB00DRAFT_832875, partial [Zychaea mexicana]|uniref:uncharacterized protein n=1 Tax=Zychaea mexicana TaxID=64656 RepID=UPI0022FE5D29